MISITIKHLTNLRIKETLPYAIWKISPNVSSSSKLISTYNEGETACSNGLLKENNTTLIIRQEKAIYKKLKANKSIFSFQRAKEK